MNRIERAAGGGLPSKEDMQIYIARIKDLMKENISTHAASMDDDALKEYFARERGGKAVKKYVQEALGASGADTNKENMIVVLPSGREIQGVNEAELKQIQAQFPNAKVK
jgi:hypothetical protein